jgi:hypothetical protein
MTGGESELVEMKLWELVGALGILGLRPRPSPLIHLASADWERGQLFVTAYSLLSMYLSIAQSSSAPRRQMMM